MVLDWFQYTAMLPLNSSFYNRHQIPTLFRTILIKYICNHKYLEQRWMRQFPWFSVLSVFSNRTRTGNKLINLHSTTTTCFEQFITTGHLCTVRMSVLLTIFKLYYIHFTMSSPHNVYCSVIIPTPQYKIFMFSKRSCNNEIHYIWNSELVFLMKLSFL